MPVPFRAGRACRCLCRHRIRQGRNGTAAGDDRAYRAALGGAAFRGDWQRRAGCGRDASLCAGGQRKFARSVPGQRLFAAAPSVYRGSGRYPRAGRRRGGGMAEPECVPRTAGDRQQGAARFYIGQRLPEAVVSARFAERGSDCGVYRAGFPRVPYHSDAGAVQQGIKHRPFETNPSGCAGYQGYRHGGRLRGKGCGSAGGVRRCAGYFAPRGGKRADAGRGTASARGAARTVGAAGNPAALSAVSPACGVLRAGRRRGSGCSAAGARFAAVRRAGAGGRPGEPRGAGKRHFARVSPVRPGRGGAGGCGGG